MIGLRAAGLLAALWACGGHAAPKGEPMSNELKPAGRGSFEPGPSITPGGQLLEWLQANGGTPGGKRPRLELPVVLKFGDEHRLEIGDAWIGTNPQADPPKDAVHLEIDDTSLGVALLDTIRTKCPKDQQSCAFVLEGVWGRLVELPIPLPPVPGPKRWPFAVLRVGGPASASTTYVGIAR